MVDICSECNFVFHETSIQASRRYRNNGPKICQECYRISNAEDRAEQREKMSNESKEEKIFRLAKHIKNTHGAISSEYLMRKFKLSYQNAEKLMSHLSQSS